MTLLSATFISASAVLRRVPLRGRGRLGLWMHRAVGARAAFTVDVEMVTGARMGVPMTSLQAWRIALTGRYDDEVVELLIRSIAPDSLVVDVGASLGLYTVPLGAATMALGGQLLAIEPLERNCRVTAANVEANGLTSVVRITRCAVGASAGTVVLHSEPGGAGNAAVVNGVAAAELARHEREGGLTHEECVDVERLDDLVRPLGRPVSLIKIDVEGLEFDVLEGATQTVHEDRPVIYAEMSAEWLRSRGVAGDALHRWLAANRYRCFEVRALHIDRWSDRRRVELREIADDRERDGHDLLLVPGESRSEFAMSLSSPARRRPPRGAADAGSHLPESRC